MSESDEKKDEKVVLSPKSKRKLLAERRKKRLLTNSGNRMDLILSDSGLEKSVNGSEKEEENKEKKEEVKETKRIVLSPKSKRRLLAERRKRKLLANSGNRMDLILSGSGMIEIEENKKESKNYEKDKDKKVVVDGDILSKLMDSVGETTEKNGEDNKKEDELNENKIKKKIEEEKDGEYDDDIKIFHSNENKKRKREKERNENELRRRERNEKIKREKERNRELLLEKNRREKRSNKKGTANKLNWKIWIVMLIALLITQSFNICDKSESIFGRLNEDSKLESYRTINEADICKNIIINEQLLILVSSFIGLFGIELVMLIPQIINKKRDDENKNKNNSLGISQLIGMKNNSLFMMAKDMMNILKKFTNIKNTITFYFFALIIGYTIGDKLIYSLMYFGTFLY